MQRLFSSFADGWPGGGLLIQRVLIGAALLHTGLHTDFSCLGATCGAQVISAGGGLFLMVGLWTPVAGLVTAILQTWVALSSSSDQRVSFLLAIFALTLSMIGPGAWSVDARLFGRKHIKPNPRGPNRAADFPQRW